MMLMIRSVGIREAKINLSKLLKEVRKGAEIFITDRGTRIAKIVAVNDEELPLADRVRNLETSGLLDPRPGNVRQLPPPLPLEPGIAQQYLQEDRS